MSRGALYTPAVVVTVTVAPGSMRSTFSPSRRVPPCRRKTSWVGRVTRGGVEDRARGSPSYPKQSRPLSNPYLRCPQCPVSEEHPGSAVQHGHLAGLDSEAWEALGQRRGVEDLVNPQAPPAGLQLRLSRRPQQQQTRLPASPQPGQLALRPLPAPSPRLLCPCEHGDTSDTWDVLRPGAGAPHTGMGVTKGRGARVGCLGRVRTLTSHSPP